MSVVIVENLSKKYIIGANSHRNLREVLTDSLSAPAQWLRRARIKRQQHRDTVQVRPDARGVRSTDFWALKNVSFDVKEGEVVGVIGRNGAGKSTLLKVLSRITEPTAGRVRIRGRVASLLEVGTGFHPELTGRENVYLNGAILGMSREEIRRKFDEIVAFAEVEQFLDTPVKRYSSGMYVRLAFAVAAHLEPEILIVDEVLAVGDAQFQKKCLGRMDNVSRQGKTIFFVSHNMASIKSLCNSAMRLSNGELVDAGEPDAVIRRYLEEYSTGGGVVQFADSDHRINSPVQIKTAEVLNSSLRPCETFSFGDDIIVRLTVNAKENTSQVRVGIGVYAEGVRISTFHSFPADLLVDRPTVFTCRLPASRLLPNLYTLHVGANSLETGRGLDWVADAIDFRVESVNVEGGKSHDTQDWGLVSLDVEWESDESPHREVGVVGAGASTERYVTLS